MTANAGVEEAGWAYDSGSVSPLGLRTLRERQKETGALYKLLAVTESLEVQH